LEQKKPTLVANGNTEKRMANEKLLKNRSRGDVITEVNRRNGYGAIREHERRTESLNLLPGEEPWSTCCTTYT
jgi:hypothetical protein